MDFRFCHAAQQPRGMAPSARARAFTPTPVFPPKPDVVCGPLMSALRHVRIFDCTLVLSAHWQQANVRVVCIPSMAPKIVTGTFF